MIKLNNRGWGMMAFLLIVLVLMIFFLIAVSRLNVIESV